MVVNVGGGFVQGVFCSDEGTETTVVDVDVEASGQDPAQDSARSLTQLNCCRMAST